MSLQIRETPEKVIVTLTDTRIFDQGQADQIGQSLRDICRQADLEVADSGTAWTGGRLEGETLSIPFKHHDGAWFGDPGETRVVLRYKGENPNGSIDRIAGISNLSGNVMGLMPHPEEAQDPLLGSVDGRVLFAALLS